MRCQFFILVLTLSACKNRIDINSIERRTHGLSYIKGTNQLVTGEVVTKLADGKITNLQNYKNGQPIGNWYGYGPNGEIASHGFGVEATKYESKLKNVDLNHCCLSISVITDSFAYATLYIDNKQLFDQQKILVDLSRLIFNEYAGEYKLNDILVFDDEHEYTVSKTAIAHNNYAIDTVIGKQKKTIFIR